MKLPDLLIYRSDFLKKGVSYPLQNVPFNSKGLLWSLPRVTNGKSGWPWTQETDPTIYGSWNIWPKLTIVTPSYNQATFIEETIRSVLLQNYPNLEFIIIDGGSTDGSQQILEKYSPWISYWQSEKDSGQGNAINLGFSLSAGNYNAWINSDDYYLKNIFYQVVTKFISTNCDFVYGYGLNFHTATQTFEHVKVLPHLDYFIKIPSLIQPSTFWKASINQALWEELWCALDFELWLRMIKGKRKRLIKQPLSVANVHLDAKTFNPKMAGKWHADHLKIWSNEGHGTVYEWKRISFLHRLRVMLYKLCNIL